MTFTYQNNSIISVPTTYTVQTNTTQASLTLQGVFMGIYDQGYQDKIYIYLSYGPNLTGSINTNIQYFLGSPSQIQTQILTWLKNPPDSAIAALNLTSTCQYLQFTYDNTSQNVSYTVPQLLDDSTGQTAIGYYTNINLQIFIFGNQEVSLYFNLQIAKPTCLNTQIQLNLPQTTISATLYNQKLLYTDFSSATNSLNLDCGPYNYQIQYQDPSNNWYDMSYNYNTTIGVLYLVANTTEFYYQSSNPTLSQAQTKWNLRFNITFLAAQNLTQSTISDAFSIEWVSPCNGRFYSIQQNQIFWSSTPVVKVEFQNSYNLSSPWEDLVSNYYKISYPSVILCTKNYTNFKVSAVVGSTNGSSAISMPNISSSNNIFIDKTSREAVGNYTITYDGFLDQAQSVKNSISFVVQIVTCNVTSITYPNTTITYTLTQPSFIQSFQGVTQSSTTSCGYAVTTTVQIPSDYTDLVSYNQTLQQFTIFSQSNLSYLSLSPLIIPYITTTDGGPDSGINSTSGNFTIYLVNPCESTTFITPTTLSLTMYAYSQKNIVTFSEILDSVSESQNDTYYCGSRNYQLQSEQTTYYPYLNLTLDNTTSTISTSQNTYQMTISSTQLSGQAVTSTTTYKLTTTLSNYSSVTSNVNTLTVIVLDPCWKTSLLNQSFNDMIVTAGQSSNTTSDSPPTYLEQNFSDFNDSESLFYNVSICRTRDYSLTIVNTTNAGNATSSNIYTKTNSTGNFIVVDATQNNNQYGEYIISLSAKLTNYQNISSAIATFKVTILPCIVNYLSINTSDSTNNLYSDRQISYVLFNQTQFSYSPYQGNICNYGWNITYSLGDASNVTWVDLNQTWIAKFNVFASSRDYINNYTVNLNYQLRDYPPSIYNVPSNYLPMYQVNYKSDINFTIQIEDPCYTSDIQLESSQSMVNLQAFYGFPEKISGQISGYNYSNWKNYTAYYSADKPVSQIYFEDTVSRQLQYFEFCGGMNFSFTSLQKLDFPISSIKGYNGYNITFSPPFTISKSEIVDVILTVGMVNPNLTQTRTVNFKVIAYVVVPPKIEGLVVTMGAYNQIQLPIGRFYFQQPQGDLSTIQQVYSAYQVLSPKYYPNNTKCEPLVQSGEFLPLPIFAQFDSSNVQFTFLNQYSLAGQYYFIVCLNFTGFSASFVTQFSHTVLNQLAWSTTTLYSPTIVLSRQFISNCSSPNDPMWKYQLPQPNAPNNSTVKITVNVGPQLFGYLDYDESIKTIQQIQRIETSGQFKIQVSLQASTGTSAQYYIQVICGCQKSPSFNSTQIVDQQQIITSKDVVAPQPKIIQITNQGLIKVQFGTQMKVTQKQLTEILNNSYVDSNNKTQQILNLTIYNPLGKVLSQVENYTFTVKSYTNESLEIQINFLNPLYVSCLSQKDAIQVQIIAYQYFKSTQNIYVQPNSTKTNLKTIPQQLENAQLVQVIQQGVNFLQSFLAANAFASPLLAGSLQLVLGVIRQLQIQTNLMLITLNYPATVNIFFSSLMTIASLTFYDCTQFFNKEMDLDNPNPINEQFDQMFYGQVYFFVNFNFPIFILPAVILGLIIVKILSNVRQKQIRNFFKKVHNHFVWNFFISYMHEMYILISINTLINYTYLKFNNFGNICNSVATLVFTFAIFIFPLTIIPFYAYNFKSFLRKNKVMIKTYGVLLDKFNLYRAGRSVLIYLAVNYLRKFSLMAFIVLFRNQPNVALYFAIHQILFVFAVNTTIRPFIFKLDQLQDMIEEITYLITTYHMICFTDWVSNPNTQNQIGMSLAVFTVISLAFSLLKVGIIMIVQVYKFFSRSFITLKRYLKLEKIRKQKRQKDLLKLARQQKSKLEKLVIYKEAQIKKFKNNERNEARNPVVNAEIKQNKLLSKSVPQNRIRIGMILHDLNLSVIKEEDIQQPSPKINEYQQYNSVEQEIDYYKNTYQGLSDLNQNIPRENPKFQKTRNLSHDQNAENQIGIAQMNRLDELERKIQNLGNEDLFSLRQPSSQSLNQQSYKNWSYFD